MEQVDFYKLSRAVQERFIGSVNGGGLPAPFLEDRSGPREPTVWLAVSAAAAGALLVSFRVGLGSLESKLATHGVLGLATTIALVAILLFGILRALAVRGAVRALPFRAGVYVFPVGLIDARRHTMKVYRIDELASTQGPDAGGKFVLAFEGGKKFALTAASPAQAAEAEAALATARGRVQEAGAARDSVRPKAMAALDPLQGFANPLVSSVPITRTPPVWARLDWGFALIGGALAGLSIWAARNALSDDRMFTAASARNDAAAYRAYLAKGKRHQDEVARVLLPRAELREAQQAGTVDAVEAFMKAHPQTGIDAEVAAAYRASLLAELDQAKRAGTLAALHAFAKRHPAHHLDAELRQATHAVYVAALESYRKQSNPKDPANVAFVERLVAYAEKNGPQVQVRFHRQVSKTMDKADAAVAKNRFFKGVVSLPSRYFDAAHLKPIEDEAAQAIVARFGQAFPREILAFDAGPGVDDPEAALPPVTTPTLFVEDEASWTGGVTTSTDPRGIYVGIGLVFGTHFAIPEDAKPVKWKTKIWRGPELGPAKGEEKPEERIYAQIAHEAYGQFAKRLLATFFKADAK